MRFRVLLEPRHGAAYDQILALARATEEAGFDAFFRSDHYLGIDVGDPTYLPTDSWTTLAGLARETSRVRLGTLMTAATFRHPGPLAIAVATADAMSGGRVELGIGTGWYEREHASFGIPFPPVRERFDRLEEQLAVITGLWGTPRGERFSFAGAHYRIDECANFPAPAQRPGPPIIIGGTGPRRTPALAARFAGEFNSGFTDDLAGNYANFRRICAESGRDPATVRLSTTLPVCCGTSRADAQRRAATLGEPGARMLRAGVIGPPGDVLRRLEQLAAAGADTTYFHIYDPDDLDHIRLLGAEVLPEMSDTETGAPARAVLPATSPRPTPPASRTVTMTTWPTGREPGPTARASDRFCRRAVDVCYGGNLVPASESGPQARRAAGVRPAPAPGRRGGDRGVVPPGYGARAQRVWGKLVEAVDESRSAHAPHLYL